MSTPTTPPPQLPSSGKPRALNTYTDMVEEAKKTYRYSKPRQTARPSARIVANPEALILPPPTEEALRSPARARAEAEGFASFGRRTWFLVERGGQFRAVESLDDAPGWSLVERMKR